MPMNYSYARPMSYAAPAYYASGNGCNGGGMSTQPPVERFSPPARPDPPTKATAEETMLMASDGKLYPLTAWYKPAPKKAEVRPTQIAQASKPVNKAPLADKARVVETVTKWEPEMVAVGILPSRAEVPAEDRPREPRATAIAKGR